MDHAGRLRPTPIGVPIRKDTSHEGHVPVVAALSDSDPADQWVPITPSDTALFDPLPIAIFVGVGGDLALEGVDGVTAVFRNLPDGSLWPFQPRKVLAAGTVGASGLVLIYRSDL